MADASKLRWKRGRNYGRLLATFNRPRRVGALDHAYIHLMHPPVGGLAISLEILATEDPFRFGCGLSGPRLDSCSSGYKRERDHDEPP